MIGTFNALGAIKLATTTTSSATPVGNLMHLSTLGTTAASTIEFNNLASYDYYEVLGVINPVTGGYYTPSVQVKTQSGWKTSADYTWTSSIISNSTNPLITTSSTGTNFPLGYPNGSSPGPYGTTTSSPAFVNIRFAVVSGYLMFTSQVAAEGGNSYPYTQWASGRLAIGATESLTGLRFAASGGQIKGELSVYGIKQG